MNNNENPNNQINPGMTVNPQNNGNPMPEQQLNPGQPINNGAAPLASNPNELNSAAPINNPYVASSQPMNQNVSPNNASVAAPVMESIPEVNTNPNPNPTLAPNNQATPVGQNPMPNDPSMVSNVPPVVPPIDNFNSVPVPPAFENEPTEKKKSNKKLIIIILLVVLVIGIGFGIYYFLSSAKVASGADINTKDYTLELGDTLSEDIMDYAIITGFDPNSCNVDTSSVTVNEVGAYSYTIKCGTTEKTGTVIIDDTTNPEVVLNDLTVVPKSSVKPEDFIDSCVDASECTYQFTDEDAVKTNLQNTGEYDTEILVSDKYGNESKVVGKLIVSNDAPVKYVTCTSEPKNVDEIFATVTENYKIGVNSQNNFFNAVRNSEFSFEELEDYKNIQNTYRDNIGINGVVGTATFNEKAKTITIKNNATLDDINKELTVSLAGDMSTLQMFFTINGYTCK